MNRILLSGVVLSTVVLVAFAPAVSAQAQTNPRAADQSRWAAIRGVFGQDGEAHAGYLRANFPRTDLRVRIGNDELDPGFELTSYLGFVPTGTREVLAVGEVVLREDEVPAALAEARRQGVSTPGLHNHLLGEQPRIMYLHISARGKAAAVAHRLQAVFAKTATPLVHQEGQPASADWSAIDAILGPHAEAEARIAEYVFPRREAITLYGITVKSTGMLETASEVVFQQLDGGRMACGGELSVLAGEIDPVTRALEENGLHVTAIHHHLVNQTPRMYWIHWYGAGEGRSLAKGVAAALARMNGARQSQAEP